MVSSYILFGNVLDLALLSLASLSLEGTLGSHFQSELPFTHARRRLLTHIHSPLGHASTCSTIGQRAKTPLLCTAAWNFTHNAITRCTAKAKSRPFPPRRGVVFHIHEILRRGHYISRTFPLCPNTAVPPF